MGYDDDTDYMKFIAMDPAVQGGVACIQGTRVPVYVILDALAAGDGISEVMEDYGISDEALRACLSYGSTLPHLRRDPSSRVLKKG